MNEVQNFINEQFGEISTVVRGVQLYLDEENLYNFMFEAKNLGYKQPNKAITRHCRYSTKHTIATKQGKKINS